MNASIRTGSLNICLVTFHDYPESTGGGEERFLEDLSNFLATRNINATIVSSTTKSNSECIIGVGIKPFRLPFFGLTPYLLLFSLLASMRIISLNKRHSFSLIHSNDIGYGGLAGLVASKILGLRLLAHSHCKRAQLQTLTVLLRHSFTRHVASLYESFEISIDKLVSRNADLVLAVSDEIRGYLCSLGVSSGKIVVSPMGLETESFESETEDKDQLFREFGIPPNAFVIGYVGSLVKAKGLDMLVKAFSLLQNQGEMKLCLLMVGDGEHKRELKKMIEEMRLQSVIIPGFRKDVARVLAAMDVFALPSLSEGCPFSLLEAMAAGKAIIATNIPSIREIVEDEKEAILINPNDCAALEKAILRLHQDVELRERLSKNARRRAHQYDVSIAFNKILGLYHYYGRRD